MAPVRNRGLAAIGTGLALAACSFEPDAADSRPQLVVIIDTDMPALGQLPAHEELSPVAAIDSVRVDVFDDAGNPIDVRDITATDERNFPITLGIASPENGGTITLRIRVFRASQSQTGSADGKVTVEPDRHLAVDRLATFELPVHGVANARVRLTGDCMGVPVSFTDRTTCIDGEHLNGAPGDGIERMPSRPDETKVGTWGAAKEVPCTGRRPEGAVCVPGGFTVLGDPDFAGLEEIVDTLPRRPVVVPPFFYDRTEVTVGEYRALSAEVTSPAPTLRDLNGDVEKYCTYLGPDDPTNDAYPLSCVSRETAQEVCALRGGSLPREAEFEHAARGRGQGRPFPWGSASPRCCHVSAARDSRTELDLVGQCDGEGPEPVGSHPKTADCEGDVSRDGLLDLGGSLREWMQDSAQDYGAPCWAGGLLRDPVCEVPEISTYSTRSSDWSAGVVTAASSLRSYSKDGYFIRGFRCRYPAGGAR